MTVVLVGSQEEVVEQSFHPRAGIRWIVVIQAVVGASVDEDKVGVHAPAIEDGTRRGGHLVDYPSRRVALIILTNGYP